MVLVAAWSWCMGGAGDWMVLVVRRIFGRILEGIVRAFWETFLGTFFGSFWRAFCEHFGRYFRINLEGILGRFILGAF